MDSVLFRSIFLRLLKFLQTKEGGLNFWGELILKKDWIIWASLLYFNFKTLKDPDSSSFIRFQWVLYNSEELLSDFWNFYKLNRGDQISGGWPTLQKVWIICPPPPPFLYFSFETFKDSNSFSFIRFQWVLYDSEELLSDFWNFYKLKRGDLISGGNQFVKLKWIKSNVMIKRMKSLRRRVKKVVV